MGQEYIELFTQCAIKYPHRRNPKQEVILGKNQGAPLKLTFLLTNENDQGGVLQISRGEVFKQGSYDLLAPAVAEAMPFAPENFEALMRLYLDGNKSSYALMNTDYDLSLMPDDLKRLRREYGIPDPAKKPLNNRARPTPKLGYS